MKGEKDEAVCNGKKICSKSAGSADSVLFSAVSTRAQGSVPDSLSVEYMLPGDTVQIKDSDIVLYAQWDNPPQVEAAADAPLNKAGFFASVIIWLKNLFN